MNQQKIKEAADRFGTPLYLFDLDTIRDRVQRFREAFRDEIELTYSMKKTIDYTGEETAVNMFWTVNETLTGGSYNVSIFADGNMIGSRTFNFE